MVRTEILQASEIVLVIGYGTVLLWELDSQLTLHIRRLRVRITHNKKSGWSTGQVVRR